MEGVQEDYKAQATLTYWEIGICGTSSLCRQIVQRDIIWWQEFLPGWNGTAKFITEDADARDLDLYTDASGKHGCGA